MHPYLRAWHAYHAHGPPGWSWDEILTQHFHHGAIISTPETFIAARGGKFQRAGGGSCATSPSVLIGYGERAKETLLKCPLEGVKLCPPNGQGHPARDEKTSTKPTNE